MRDLKSLPKKHLLMVMEKMAKELAELREENKRLENWRKRDLSLRYDWGFLGRIALFFLRKIGK